MKPLTFLTILATALALPAHAQHSHGAGVAAPAAPEGRPAGRGGMREWTRQPILIGRPAKDDRAAAGITARGLVASGVTVFAADGPTERRKRDFPNGPEGTSIDAVAPKTGNYHWVIAREESPDTVKVASTAWYFGNPGDAPSDMLAQSKHELELVPAPLPREHRSYREAEKWRFLVRFNGQPLAAQTVALETEFGSRSTAITDANGIATIVFPRDFKPAPKVDGEGDDPRARGRFVLSTEKEDSGKRYLTAFNHSYTQDPERSRSLGWGAAFGILGMVAATPLLRRRQQTQGGKDHA
ncbi:MAG: hypothetical protein HZA62_10045 [Rhodocyclales bacterium]|nr:hypothetical protein [Rhodocyclales bacterium]